LVVLFLAGFSTAITPLNPVPAASLDKERQQAFEWMDGLGFPDIRRLPFVRVQLGCFDPGADDPVKVYKFGFLLEDKGNTFKILGTDTAITVHERTAPDEQEHLRIDYEPADLIKHVTLPSNPNDWRERRMRMMIVQQEMEQPAPASSETTQLFLAWACSRRGYTELSANLFKQLHKANAAERREVELFVPSLAVESFYNGRISPSPAPASPKIPTLQEQVANNLAHVEMSRAFFAFRDRKMSRAELLPLFAHIVKHYPGTPVHAQACETALQLKSMVEEDIARAAQKQRPPFEKLSPKEQLAELVYLLRDQTGVTDERGQCAILGHDQNSPASKLAAKGYAAVPLLLAALEDRRLTRAVPPMQHNRYSSFTYSQFSVLTVADCAEAILKQLAGISIYDEPLTNSTYAMALSTQERMPEALPRAVFSAWYADLRVKGEKRLLIEATARGDQDSLEQGRRLVERYPSDALPALIAGARSGKIYRKAFVEAICLITGDPATAFLLTEVKEGPFDCRYVAAEGLQERNRPEGLAAMIAEWQDQNPRLYSLSHDERTSQRNYSQLALFLANSGQAEGIAALARNLHKRPIDLRINIIRMMADEVGNQGPIGDKLQAAMEALLVSCLDDAEERFADTVSDFRRGRELTIESRICDMAAQTLSEIWPAKYSFDNITAPANRNIRIVELKNIWRLANKLPALPVPQPRTFARVPAKIVNPLLENYLQATDAAQKRQALDEIEKLGVGAFWAVLDYRDSLIDTGKQHRDLVDGLAKKIACTIVDVDFAVGSLQPDAALRQRLEALKNRPLDSNHFVQAVEAAVKTLPADVHALHLTAMRSGDGTGITLVVDLLSRDWAPGSIPGREYPITPKAGEPEKAKMLALENAGKNMADPSRRLYFDARVRVGMGSLRNEWQVVQGGNNNWRAVRVSGLVFQVSQSSCGQYFQPASWPAADLRKSIDDAVAAVPGEPIELSVRFSRNGPMAARNEIYPFP
jgi:hypothetical protein